MSSRKNTSKNNKDMSDSIMILAYIKENVESDEPIMLTRRVFGKKDIDLLYDEVEDLFFEQFDKIFPEEDYPNSTIEYFIKKEGVEYPIISESDKEKIKELKKEKVDFLVLPDATYHLTDECKMYMKLKELGILDEESPFNFDLMHELIETTNKGK